MTPFQSPAIAIAAINLHLLSAFLSALACLWLWPSNTHDWMYGIWSILFGFAAALMLLEAVKKAVQLYRRDQVIAAYLKQGARPKTAQMASNNALARAGMMDE